MKKSFVFLVALLCFTQPLCAQSVLDDAAQRGPAVAAIMELPRETPAEQLRAMFTLLDLGETGVAAELWKSFDQEGLDAQTQATLVAQFGTARFLTLTRQDANQFAGARKFVATCLETSAQRARDPQRLARLIGQLNDPSAELRSAARVDLAATSTAGAVACLEALAQTTEKQQRVNLLLTLAEMRPEVDPLLLAVLADGRGQVRRDVAELAGHAQLLEAVPWLAAIASGVETDAKVVSAARSALARLHLSLPNTADARGVIRTEISRIETGVSPSHRPQADRDLWWSFEPTAGKLVARELSSEARQLLAAARLARLLPQLPGSTADDRRIALIYAYQVAEELGQAASDEMQQQLADLDVNELNEALAQALKKDAIPAARALTKLLGKRADATALASTAGRPAPLARTLLHSDRSLRYAALRAVMQIAPEQTFAGASGVPKSLWYFATGAGAPQAVVASPLSAAAGDWSGQLRGLGYDATPTQTGNETLRAAFRAPRLQLLLVDSDISRPQLREVLFQLRSHPHTARLPIGVLCSLENLRRAQLIAAGDDWLLAVPRPHSDQALRAIVERLTEFTGDDSSAEQRLAQAAQALGWIAELLETGHPYDELLRESKQIVQTVFVPELTELSLRVLAALDTADSQRLLVDLASTAGQPIEIRRQAVRALAACVDRAGKLLTTQEIQRQYDRYNASETADAPTQEVLGEVLDILEAKP
ncbi:MAG: hypothetical protein MI725_08410 [Pirellulales bacterium]|nr:hypothetical protein [Pirellulales bacterium]